MGKRGPAPLPTALKAARGTRRKGRELPGKEPTPKAGEPPVPESVRLDRDALKCWSRLVPMLLKLKLLTEADAWALESLCVHYARATQAEREIRAKGLTVTTAWGTIQTNPAVGIARASWAEMNKVAQQFGLTPSARTKVRATETIEDDEEGADSFFFGAQKSSAVVGNIARKRA